MLINNEVDLLLMGDNGLDTVGGEQESTKIIINGLKDKYSIGVIQPGRVSNPKSGVNYFHLTEQTRIKHIVKNPLKFIRYILKVKKVINDKKPKVIHTQAQVSFFIVALLKKFKLISKDNYLIHTERGLYTKYNQQFKQIFFFFMKELNTLVTTTQFNMNYWKSSLKARKISLDYQVIENTAGELFEFYEEALDKKNSTTITIGFAGRYTNWKNWPLAMEISEKLNNKMNGNVNVKMAVGCLDEKALSETKEMFEKLEEELQGNFDGYINITLEEMNKFYYDIDVFVLTSNYNTESFGRTVVEAMSRKTAVLTTDAGGTVEVVGNKKNVLSNSDDFVKRITEFDYNREYLNHEKEANLNRVKKMYSLNNNINKHGLLYRKLI